LHCCNGLGTSHIVMQGALRILRTSRPDVKICIVDNFAFEVEEHALKMQSALLQVMGHPCVQVGGIEKLPLLVQQCGPRWLKSDVVVCFVNSWPCKNTSRAAPLKNRPEGSGLHMQHSRRMWDIDQGIFLLHNMQMVPHRIAHFTEYPQCGNAGEEAVVDRLFGKAFVSNPSCYRAANRARNMRTAPGNLEVKLYHHPIEPKGPLNGWTWCGNNKNDDKFPQVTLRSYIVALVENEVYQSRELEEFEKQTLSRCRMRHEDGQRTAYISRDFWMLWLGFDQTPVPKIAADLLPCLGYVQVATGTAGVVNTCGVSMCCTDRYCKNCEQVLLMLGQAWHVQSMTDVAVAWLDKIIARHCLGDSSIDWFGRPPEPSHSCGPMCSENPRPGI
jgi:hypothetical protein